MDKQKQQSKTDDEIVSAHMSKMAKARWKNKTPEQRAQEQREKILRRYKKA